MSDTTLELDENEVPTSYSSSTPAAATNRKAITAPGAGTGRRKEAVARVRPRCASHPTERHALSKPPCVRLSGQACSQLEGLFRWNQGLCSFLQLFSRQGSDAPPGPGCVISERRCLRRFGPGCVRQGVDRCVPRPRPHPPWRLLAPCSTASIATKPGRCWSAVNRLAP